MHGGIAGGYIARTSEVLHAKLFKTKEAEWQLRTNKPLLMKSADGRTLTGFFFTCWVAAHLEKKKTSVQCLNTSHWKETNKTLRRNLTCAHLVMEEYTSLSSCPALLEMLLCCNQRHASKFTQINSDGGQNLHCKDFRNKSQLGGTSRRNQIVWPSLHTGWLSPCTT